MWILGLLLLLPLCFILLVLLVRYWRFCRLHKDLVSFEVRRESLRWVNAKPDVDKFDEWWRRKSFEARYNRASRNVRKQSRRKYR